VLPRIQADRDQNLTKVEKFWKITKVIYLNLLIEVLGSTE
jgi:hypothetical protein